MPLITLNNVDYGVGGPLLLSDVVLSIEPGERIALIGRNGAGKSPLMKLIAGDIHADDGEVRREGGVRIARLEQEVPPGADGDVWLRGGRQVSNRAPNIAELFLARTQTLSFSAIGDLCSEFNSISALSASVA